MAFEGKKKKALNYILILIFSLLIAFFTEFVFNLGSEDLRQIIKPGREMKTPKVSDAYLIGCHEEDGKIIADDDDPQLIFSGVDKFVSAVIIDYDKPNYSLIPGVVFYKNGLGVDENGNEEFSEENSVSFPVRIDKRSVYIKMDSYVSDLRIDIGAGKGSEVKPVRIVLNPSITIYFSSALRNLSPVRMAIFLIISLTVLLAINDFGSFKKNLHKYRWIIGGLVIIFGTVFKLSGSSIGRMAELMQGLDTGLLLGQNRAIRTDEYVAFTEMALSQVKSGFGWFSDIWGYSPSDMFMIYGQPVMNPVTLLRPFSVGYILLGAERGLAFYWISRIVVGLLVSYEFGRMITKDDRQFSFVYSVLVIFAPVVQWWFSTNEFVEMLIAGQCALMIIHKYIELNGALNILKKILLSLGFGFCALVYALSLYPAWMIPLVYVFAACAAAIVLEKRKSVKIRFYDILIWVFTAAICAGCFVYIYRNSEEAIKSILNTSYPGTRSYVGGPIINVSELFRGWTSYIWSFVDAHNPCEEVCFISFFPLGIILSVIALFKNKIKDTWLIALNAVNTLLILYAVIPFPEFVGKLTLLNKSHNMRIIIVIGFLNLLILIRALYVLGSCELKKYRIMFIAVSVLSCIVSIFNFDEKESAVVSIIVLLVAGLSGYIICGISKRETRNIFVTLCFALAIVGGVTVNPVSRGLESLYKEPQMVAIEDINKKEPGTWIVVGSYVFSDLPAIVGADTASALDTYPDEALWTDLGLENERETWNRYAHKIVRIGDETSLTLEQSDLVTLVISTDKLKDLGIRYLFSIEDLSEYEELENIYSYTNFDIYRVK